jgi:uncharacterized protein (DUF952 family)
VHFHLAAEHDWDLASRSGVYAPDSLTNEGFIHCSSAEQLLTVANTLFAGRTDLVLLMIDGTRLRHEVRFEGADDDGRPFPHVYGPLDLEAVFNAEPYRPAEDGLFERHEETGGFAAHGAATIGEVRQRALAAMASFHRPWWVAGGWAMDLFLARKTRPHADLEISILRSDQGELFEYLSGWDLRLAAAGALHGWNGDIIERPWHQVWARNGPGRPTDVEEFGNDPTFLDFLLEEERDGGWAFRRLPTISRPIEEFGATTPEGVPIVRPEVALLYKAKSTRFKDQRDFEVVRPHLDEAARAWLAATLDEAHPDHPWKAMF